MNDNGTFFVDINFDLFFPCEKETDSSQIGLWSFIFHALSSKTPIALVRPAVGL